MFRISLVQQQNKCINNSTNTIIHHLMKSRFSTTTQTSPSIPKHITAWLLGMGTSIASVTTVSNIINKDTNTNKQIIPEIKPEIFSYLYNTTNSNNLMLFASLTVLGTLFMITIQNNSFSSVNKMNDYAQDNINILQDILNSVNTLKFEHNAASLNQILANQELLITMAQQKVGYTVHSSVYDMAEKLTYI